MDPPSYEEATTQPYTLSPSTVNDQDPPSYQAACPLGAPLPYEATTVIQQPDPFPVLTVPASPTQVIVHQPTLVSGRLDVGVRPRVAVSQPQSVHPIPICQLRDKPGLVHCSKCNQSVTTRVQRRPNSFAVTLCVVIGASLLICGCCLIPFMIPSNWVVHHYCPLCGEHLYSHDCQ
ncbi:lipopolysaccharide-induced tumor necrosis factor-alpha factor homolog [Entelurus aequoreus]|uniref:lipopolysaccharide-induced tumor necrosis factor-alpha factor homolog n=1 Tax=Entelurus aequoreus TaxID=161455 RepID=UPI002B1DFCC6|nr:lipopolysaccharide-induced tumor necrosis factor-alpha factor homolog [Entelurus aequoreus]XP_061882590.1 lipopolysaccharide-induced tumor necrosis factor-alpha factor homolog [Entelurus aequoreus]